MDTPRIPPSDAPSGNPSEPDPLTFAPRTLEQVRATFANDCRRHADLVLQMVREEGASPLELRSELVRAAVLLKTAARLLR